MPPFTRASIRRAVTVPAAIILVTVGALVLSAPEASAGTVIHVPGDQPTIQAGIGAATDGDIVLVAPGTYDENLNFEGKAITVASSNGPGLTVVDGQSLGPVVTFSSGEGRASILRGFTLQHGSSGSDGGGIVIGSSSPTVVGNVITDNVACDSGGGIAIDFGSPLIKRNRIVANGQSACSGGVGGGGIKVAGAGSAQIIGNLIAGNSWPTASGGGISLFAAGTPLIENNSIRGNSAFGSGGGVWVVNQSDAAIVQNLVVGNTAALGGGISWVVPAGDRGPFVVNNTLAYNSSPQGPELWGGGFQAQTEVWNNIAGGFSGETPIYCSGTFSQAPPLLVANNSYAPGGAGFGGTCAAALGTNGNISADPLFVSAHNYHLQSGSPSIDAGDNTAPDLPPKDIDGDPRIVGDAIDQGVDEVV